MYLYIFNFNDLVNEIFRTSSLRWGSLHDILNQSSHRTLLLYWEVIQVLQNNDNLDQTFMKNSEAANVKNSDW